MAQFGDIVAATKSGRPLLEVMREWLSAHGAEVLEPTNPWEVLRFRDGEGVHIIYKNKRKTLTFQGRSQQLWEVFKHNSKWKPTPIVPKTRSKSLTPQLQAVLKRDGDDCWYCGGPLDDDVTAEHLVARNFGGPNHLANIVAAHYECNRRAGHLSVAEKVLLRERLRRPTRMTDEEIADTLLSAAGLHAFDPVPTVMDPLSLSDQPFPIDSVIRRAISQEGGLVDDGPWDDILNIAAGFIASTRGK